MTHEELVAAAARWLRAQRHRIVLSDVRVQPDAIGWTLSGFSTLVECKASRADFLRDAEKTFRKVPSRGMGWRRYYLAPAGLLAVCDLPEAWGLLEVAERGRVRLRHRAANAPEWNRVEEHLLVLAALARATEGWGRRMFGEIAPPAADGDPHPTASRTIRELRAEVLKLRAELRSRAHVVQT